MNLRFIDWIWHVRGSVPLAPGQSSDEAFERLDPLFRQGGTSHERADDILTFQKKDQAAQDKMSIFDGGTLRIEKGVAGSVLRYNLVSRALLFCFLAPLLFLAFGGLTIGIGKMEAASAEASGKAKDAEKKDEKKDKALPQHWIDKMLGAPAPEKPKDEKEKAKEKAKDRAKDKEKDSKHSPTPAYVFAGLFALLYVVGRVLEDRLIKSVFRKKLLGV